MTPREFLIAFGPALRQLARDLNEMSAPAFERKHGIDVRECRVKFKRLKALAAERQVDGGEVRELVGLFTAICYRQATEGRL